MTVLLTYCEPLKGRAWVPVKVPPQRLSFPYIEKARKVLKEYDPNQGCGGQAGRVQE